MRMMRVPTWGASERLRSRFLASFRPADLAVGLGTLALLYVAARVGAESFVRFHPPDIIPTVSLDPRNLPNYAARSTLRMFIALIFSTLFTFVYGYAAARSQRAERVLVPLAGHPAIGSGVGISFRHGHRIHCVVSRQPARPGSGFHLRHLHRPGLEHDIFVLSVAANRARELDEMATLLSALEVGAIHAAGTARLR